MPHPHSFASSGRALGYAFASIALASFFTVAMHPSEQTKILCPSISAHLSRSIALASTGHVSLPRKTTVTFSFVACVAAGLSPSWGFGVGVGVGAWANAPAENTAAASVIEKTRFIELLL